jgi:hypothetical protein
MTTRTTQTVARFSSPFLLPGFAAPQPAGDYRVDQDEELIEGMSRLAWRRVSAFIHLPATSVKGSTRQMVAINPADLDAVLEKDLRTIMTSTSALRRSRLPIRHDTAIQRRNLC